MENGNIIVMTTIMMMMLLDDAFILKLTVSIRQICTKYHMQYMQDKIISTFTTKMTAFDS